MDRGRAFTFLKAIDTHDAAEGLGVYVSRLEDQPLVVTDDGTPVAVLVPVRGIDLEDLSLGTDPEFLEALEQSRRRTREGGTISSEEMRRRLGIG